MKNLYKSHLITSVDDYQRVLNLNKSGINIYPKYENSVDISVDEIAEDFQKIENYNGLYFLRVVYNILMHKLLGDKTLNINSYLMILSDIKEFSYNEIDVDKWYEKCISILFKIS